MPPLKMGTGRTGMILFPYQKEDIEKAMSLFGFKNNNSIYLAHEPGLGKTIMALEIASRFAIQINYWLVICPSSAKGVWKSAIEERGCGEVQIIANGKDNFISCFSRQSCTNFHIFFITSYDLAISPLIAAQLLQLKNFGMICDEAHCLGTIGSKRSKLILKELFPLASRKIFLSGSVTRNKGIQLWPIFHTICPDKIPPYWPFAYKYCEVRVSKFGKMAGGLKNKEAAKELGDIARENFLIRRLKKEVLTQLPEKLEQKVLLRLDNSNRYEQAARDFGDELSECQETEKPPSEHLATAYRELGLKKVPYICEYIEELILELNPDWRPDVHAKSPVVVFCWHKEVYGQLITRLSRFRPEGFSSNATAKERERTIYRFQLGKGSLFVCSYAASEAITLTRANVVVRAELAWSRSLNEQAVDRVHRIGQEKQVYIKNIIAEGTLDDVVYSGLKRKLSEHKNLFGERNGARTYTAIK